LLEGTPWREHFVRFLPAYSGERLKIKAVTVQKEVDTDQNCRMPALGGKSKKSNLQRAISARLLSAPLSTPRSGF
jgi:hypothetical protein